MFRSNKIIVTNPRKITDEMALDFYKKSQIPEVAYYKTLGVVSIMNYRNTALTILREKVNKENIDLALEEWNDFIERGGTGNRKKSSALVKEIDDYLNEIKSPLDISLCITKDPYIKVLTEDKIINLTGQSGSGKSTYAKKYFDSDKYVIIDTDDIFSEKRFQEATGLNKELGYMFRKKYKVLPNLAENFDLIYNEIIDFCNNYNKIIVIDCALFHCVKDLKILKGKLIIIRTDIDTCYKRTINRWIEHQKMKKYDYTNDEFNEYFERKKSIYKWYKETNKFIRRIDQKY